VRPLQVERFSEWATEGGRLAGVFSLTDPHHGEPGQCANFPGGGPTHGTLTYVHSGIQKDTLRNGKTNAILALASYETWESFLLEVSRMANGDLFHGLATEETFAICPDCEKKWSVRIALEMDGLPQPVSFCPMCGAEFITPTALLATKGRVYR
jgi:hypothetical protein